MKLKAPEKRLAVTYWIKNPVDWAAFFAPRAKAQEEAGIHLTKMKIKAHPKRSRPVYLYKVTLTAWIDMDKEKAAKKFMKKNYKCCHDAGIQESSITNVWCC